MDGDRAFLVELAGLFLKDHSSWLCEIAEGLAKGAASRVRSGAHSLKGATYCFSADAVTDAAERLEQAAAGGDLVACATIHPLLLAEVSRLDQALVCLVQATPTARCPVISGFENANVSTPG